MTIDERLQALTMNLELPWRQSEQHDKQLERDGQFINQLAKVAGETNDSVKRLANSVDALLHIAESQERRITHTDGGL